MSKRIATALIGLLAAAVASAAEPGLLLREGN